MVTSLLSALPHSVIKIFHEGTGIYWDGRTAPPTGHRNQAFKRATIPVLTSDEGENSISPIALIIAVLRSKLKGQKKPRPKTKERGKERECVFLSN